MLCQFQQETDQREGFDLSPEELVVGIVPLLLPIFSLTGWICNFFFDLPHSAPLFLLVIIPHHLVDGTNVFRSVFLEVLDVQLCDKLGKRQLPGFLLRVGQDAELLGIQPQLSGRLEVRMGKMVAPLRIDPSLVFFRYLTLCQRTGTYRLSVW
jgi:hypothetical protein